jgi:hypothetical protein
LDPNSRFHYHHPWRRTLVCDLGRSRSSNRV